MPKYVWHDFYLSLRRDIETNYKAGDRYLTVRAIADKFSVSLQTAQRGVTNLALENVITSRPRAGIIVCDVKKAVPSISGRRVLVISAKRDRRFYTSFLNGVHSCFEKVGVEVNFTVNDFPSETSLAFGNHLLQQGADGIIALSFPRSALPFYHAMREGQDIVSDIILDDLPGLPSIQTNNYVHSHEAGRILGSHKCERYFMIGYDSIERNRRWKGFVDGINKAAETASKPRISYICLAGNNAIGNVIAALLSHGNDAGFFIADWSANYLFGALCLQEGMQPQMTLVYDADDAYFCLQGLEPIRAVAPPFNELGRRLAEVLLYKWQTGHLKEPLQEKI